MATKTIKEFTDALNALVPGMAAKPKAQELIKAYAKYAQEKKGAEDTKKFGAWLSAPEGQAAVTAATADEADKAAVLAYMADKEANDPVLKESFAGEKFDVKKEGNWLGDNWPLLAAVAAPLLLGNFFELGTIGTILVGVLGLGAAAVFSNENSILAPVGNFIKKQTDFGNGPLFGLMSPEKSAGADKGAGGDKGATPPVKLPVLDVESGMKAALGGADKMVDIEVGADKQKVRLLGKSGATTFDSYVLLDADNKPFGNPIQLPATAKPPIVTESGKPVFTMTAEAATNLSSNTAFKDAVKALKAVKKPDAPAPSATETILTDKKVNLSINRTDVPSMESDQRTVSATVKITEGNKTDGKGTISGYTLSDGKGAAKGMKVDLSTPVPVVIKGGKLFAADGKTPFKPDEKTIADLTKKAQAENDKATTAQFVTEPTGKTVDLFVTQSKPFPQSVMDKREVDVTVKMAKDATKTGSDAEITEYVLKDGKGATGIKVVLPKPVAVKYVNGQLMNADGVTPFTPDPKVLTELKTKGQEQNNLASFSFLPDFLPPAADAKPENPDMKRAAAQADLVSGNFKLAKTDGPMAVAALPETPEGTKPITLLATSNTSPDVAREFHGHYDECTGDLTITHLVVKDDKGNLLTLELKDKKTFENGINPADGSINTEVLNTKESLVANPFTSSIKIPSALTQFVGKFGAETITKPGAPSPDLEKIVTIPTGLPPVQITVPGMGK